MINDEKKKQIDNIIRRIKRKYDEFSPKNLVEIKEFLWRVKLEIPFNISKEDLMRYYQKNAFKYRFNHQKSKDVDKQIFLTYRGEKDGSSFSYIKLH
jgi:hypothetical protein